MNPSFLTSIPFLAFLAPIVMLWGQIKGLISQIISIFIVNVVVEGEPAQALSLYLQKNTYKLPTNTIKYDGRNEYIIKKRSFKMVLLRTINGLKSQLFWINNSLLSVSDMSGVDKETQRNNDFKISLKFLRSTIDHKKLLINAVEWYENTFDKEYSEYKLYPRFHIKRYVGNRGQQNGENLKFANAKESGVSLLSPKASQPLMHSDLINYQLEDIGYAKKNFFYANNEQSKKIHEDVSFWLKSKKWHEEKGLLHRRGALLYGPAGSGKTSLIRKIAQDLDLPLYLFELNTMDDNEFIKYWEEAGYGGPCIIVFEDIDCTFKKRENISKFGKLSFECVLNCISGIVPSEGIYLFVTTNKLEYLDEALGIPNERGISTRPGRLDTCFEIGNVTENQKREIGKYFLQEYPELIEKLIKESNGCTSAQFNDMCSQIALKLYWEKQKK